MLKDITGIRLCGANFESLTDILLLDPHEENSSKIKQIKGSLIYGRNGAGKSTLAKAVKKARGEFQDTISQADFLGTNNTPLVLSEEEKSRIYVFDEDYIDKNIKLRESGLSTIIMLGQQAELEEQIQAAHKELEEVNSELNAQKSIVLEYEKVECEKSPKYHMKCIRSALQGDECWAGRDKLIKGNRQNTAIRDDTYKQFVTLSTTKTRDQLIVEFNETLKELRNAQQGDASIQTRVPTFSLDYDEEKLSNLLNTILEKPDLSERERYLLDLVQTGKTAHLNYMFDLFSDAKICMCPTCMQPVSETYKHDLVQSIQKVLSKVVEEHQSSLQKFMLQDIEMDFTQFTKLTENIDLCLRLVSQINTTIKNNNIIIQGNASEYELVIGNIMRQMLEAFSTFQYKKGIEEVSTDQNILAVLPDEEYRIYFENLMYRLILNNGSHRLNQTKSMSDMNFFTVISSSEKQRTAKELLCFIFLLNERHLLSHLEGCEDVMTNLTLWCNEIKSKVVTHL